VENLIGHSAALAAKMLTIQYQLIIWASVLAMKTVQCLLGRRYFRCIFYHKQLLFWNIQPPFKSTYGKDTLALD
jgi:hypothetical protein